MTGAVTAEAAEATGLRAGTPVVAGGGDQSAAAVGVGAVEPGVVSLSLGTSGVVFATTDGPRIEPEGRLHAFCHCVPDRWHVMGVMLSAAGSLRWFRDARGARTSGSPSLVDEAASVPAGSDGLLFLPYLTGERTPHPDPRARGAFVGLTVHHGRAHLTRAVLEGVAFGLRDSLELTRNLGVPVSAPIRATGGGSRGVLWRRILADVFREPVATTSTSEGAAQGAAMLAGVGVGWFASVEEACRELVRLGGRDRAVRGRRRRTRTPTRATGRSTPRSRRPSTPRREAVSVPEGTPQTAPARKTASMTRMLATASSGGIGTGRPSRTAAANRSAWTV